MERSKNGVHLDTYYSSKKNGRYFKLVLWLGKKSAVLRHIQYHKINYGKVVSIATLKKDYTEIDGQLEEKE